MDYILKHSTKVVQFLTLVIIVELLVVFLPTFKNDIQEARGVLEANATYIVEICKDEPYRPTCYEEKIPQLLDEITVQEAFDVIRLVRAKDTEYQFCHVLAHELGVREVSKDPDLWFDVIPLNPVDGLCSNGFIHGAAVARFSQETFTKEEIEHVIPDIEIACEARGEWRPTGLDQAICYHGIGHVFVHLTNADLKASLDMCDIVSIKNDGRNYLRVCEEGVFMQIFQPLEPEDFALIDKLDIEPQKETLQEFCDYYARNVTEWSACWREGWPLYDKEVKTAEGIVNFCNKSPTPKQESKCYETVLSIRGRSSLGDPAKMATVCNNLPEERQKKCYAIGAGTTIEEDRNKVSKSVAFCARAENKEVEHACYDHLLQTATFNFHPQSSEVEALCAALPNPWRDQCVGKLL